MKIQVIVHEAEEGGFWAEAPAIPGCATQGETMDDLLTNVREAVAGCLSGNPYVNSIGRVPEVPGVQSRDNARGTGENILDAYLRMIEVESERLF